MIDCGLYDPRSSTPSAYPRWRRFGQLAAKEALGEITPDEAAELERLTVERRAWLLPWNRPQYIGQKKDSTHVPFYRNLPKHRRRK